MKMFDMETIEKKIYLKLFDLGYIHSYVNNYFISGVI